MRDCLLKESRRNTGLLPLFGKTVMLKKNRFILVALFTPVAIIFIAFFILPMVRLTLESATGPKGPGLYLEMLTTRRYLETLFYTVILSVAVTAATLVISGITGVFLQRNHFFGKRSYPPAGLALPQDGFQLDQFRTVYKAPEWAVSPHRLRNRWQRTHHSDAISYPLH